ncbi:hypothetical protein CKO32_05070 [Afifella marina DSM 2698]|nr:hypothetical protein [Afifella marina DSM 2698]MBK1625926.1 hypothetical protein [Afifella marina]MBK5917750.1 hypothetical protein [Afifella marina]RAI23664.1 hypothetical protein CH311_01980 [Afifella marina DSM 2698]
MSERPKGAASCGSAQSPLRPAIEGIKARLAVERAQKRDGFDDRLEIDTRQSDDEALRSPRLGLWPFPPGPGPIGALSLPGSQVFRLCEIAHRFAVPLLSLEAAA